MISSFFLYACVISDFCVRVCEKKIQYMRDNESHFQILNDLQNFLEIWYEYRTSWSTEVIAFQEIISHFNIVFYIYL
jgi:hypothetical protein